MAESNDDRLWRIARKRADFKRNLTSYVVVNIFLWLVWWFTDGQKNGFNGYPWPVWVSLAWGIGIVMQYFEAYNGSQKDMAEREYEKLKRKQEGI